MREILFRGKRVDNGEWIEGYLIQKDGETFIASYPYFTGKIHETSWLEFCFGGFITVNPETVGQRVSNLTDKYGKKIFEGDVLNVHDQIPMFDGYDTDEIVYNGKVMYIKNQGMYVCEGNNDGNALCALNLDKCEVIGNIHDDPDLLGGDDE